MKTMKDREIANNITKEIDEKKKRIDILTHMVDSIKDMIEETKNEVTELENALVHAIEDAVKEDGFYTTKDGYAIEGIFEYRGFKCVIALMSLGHRCGYVGVAKDINDSILCNLYGTDYYDWSISCHGGLTYSGNGYPLNDGLWYFGFDCGHYSDGKDFNAMLKYFGDDEEVRNAVSRWIEWGDTKGEVRSYDYVRNELMGIVNQLLDDEDDFDDEYPWDDSNGLDELDMESGTETM